MKNKKTPLEKLNSFETESGIDCAALKEFYESPKMLFVPLRVEEHLMVCAKLQFQCDKLQKTS